MSNFHLTPQQALSDLAADEKEFRQLFVHGSLSVEIYKPEETDKQTPHSRDEVYIIVAGSARFVRAGKTIHCGQGDFIFVPAGMEHRFEDFSQDFSTWVLFYGPEGGESGVDHKEILP